MNGCASYQNTRSPGPSCNNGTVVEAVEPVDRTEVNFRPRRLRELDPAPDRAFDRLFGWDGHEIKAGSLIVLEPGMVFTVEPGIYVDGEGGARFGERFS